MANEKEKQFAKDLKANQDASDKLDKELNAPTTNQSRLSESELSKEYKEFNQMIDPVKMANSKRKKEILEEYGGVRTNIPLNHPEFWNL